MDNAQLYQWLKDEGITLKEAAATTGYAYQYLVGLVNGSQPMTDAARLRFVRAYPETAVFLIPELATQEVPA